MTRMIRMGKKKKGGMEITITTNLIMKTLMKCMRVMMKMTLEAVNGEVMWMREMRKKMKKMKIVSDGVDHERGKELEERRLERISERRGVGKVGRGRREFG